MLWDQIVGVLFMLVILVFICSLLGWGFTWLFKKNGYRWKRVTLISSVLSVVLLILLVVVAQFTGNQDKPATQKIYPVRVTQITTDKHQDWRFSGTTKAPDNATVVVITGKDGDHNIPLAQTSAGKLPKVRNGKVQATVLGASGVRTTEKYQAGQTAKLRVVAISHYDKKMGTALSDKMVAKVNAKSKTTVFKLTAAQARYLNGDEAESSTESSTKRTHDGSYSATEGENNARKYSYGDFVKSDDWNGKSYHISKAEVLQADESAGQTTLLVYTDEDPSHLFMVSHEGKTTAVEDDYVDIQGVFGDRQTYETKLGGSNTVPSLTAKKITVTGQATD
ncbi:hypothetical protein LAPL110952_05175 [Lactiplantibacillus plajomi]